MNVSKEHKATARRLMRTGAVFMKVIREIQGIRQAAHAKAIGEHRANLASLENGTRTPSMSALVALADSLGYRVVMTIEKKTEAPESQLQGGK